MDSISEKIFDFLVKIPKRYYLFTIIIVAGVICLGIGLTQLSNANMQVSQDTQLTNNQPTITNAISLGSLKVDIEGAVMNPGVYSLSQNARVQDVLVAAGGLSSTADREVVAKTINLAAKLTDGEKIYIPKQGEPVSNAVSNGEVLGAQAGLVNINTASASDLDALPGIGPATAQKIIAARPFSSVDDLVAKKVVSQSVFTKIKDKVTVN